MPTTCRLRHRGDSNLGGHDALGYKIGYVMQGDAESGHSGGVMITRETMLVYLRDMGVAVGSHAIGTKYGHGGADTAGSNGYLLPFTIDSGYSSFSGVNGHEGNGPVDLYLCACVINEDCPDYFT